MGLNTVEYTFICLFGGFIYFTALPAATTAYRNLSSPARVSVVTSCRDLTSIYSNYPNAICSSFSTLSLVHRLN